MYPFLSVLVLNGLDARLHQYINGEMLLKVISTINTTFKENFYIGFAPKTSKC